MTSGTKSLRLKAVTAVDLEAFIRVLQLFQGCSLVPKRISVERTLVRGSSLEILELQIEVAAADICIDAMRLITAKTQQIPTTMSAVFEKE